MTHIRMTKPVCVRFQVIRPKLGGDMNRSVDWERSLNSHWNPQVSLDVRCSGRSASEMTKTVQMLKSGKVNRTP